PLMVEQRPGNDHHWRGGRCDHLSNRHRTRPLRRVASLILTFMARAVVLLSGLDSATCLAIAKSEGYECYPLSFDYGQRHRIELQRAAELAKALQAKEHKIITIDLRTFGGSALTADMEVPKARIENPKSKIQNPLIPITYVP